MPFDWDDRKARENELKHGITFEDAAALLEGDYVAFRANVKNEVRFKAIARERGEYFAIVFTVRLRNIRIISARHATSGERSSYEKYFS